MLSEGAFTRVRSQGGARVASQKERGASWHLVFFGIAWWIMPDRAQDAAPVGRPPSLVTECEKSAALFSVLAFDKEGNC